MAEITCKTHPDAPHGFDRNASHNADRYVCECENWEPKPVAHVYRIEANGRPCVAWDDASEIKVGAKLYAAELRKALETEPFEYWNAVEGWVKIDEVREHFDAVGCGTIYKSAGEGRSPLYTAPPKKQWVSLTDQEVWQAIDNVLEGGGWLDVARVLEQAFKEKNR